MNDNSDPSAVEDVYQRNNRVSIMLVSSLSSLSKKSICSLDDEDDFSFSDTSSSSSGDDDSATATNSSTEDEFKQKRRSNSVEYSISPSKSEYMANELAVSKDSHSTTGSDESRREQRSNSIEEANGSGWTKGTIVPTRSISQLTLKSNQNVNSESGNATATATQAIGGSGSGNGNNSNSKGTIGKGTIGKNKLFTGTVSRGGLASAKKFVSPYLYSSSVLVPVDKSSQLSLNIASTETVQTSKKSYTVYVISIKSNDVVWTVVRRYKHVRAFSVKIQGEVPSLATFVFPSKKIIGNMNPQFIKQRCNQLQLFFNAICESSLAKQSRNLKVFLDPNFSPSLKSITTPSKEGYLYLLIHRVGLSRKKRKWKKVYCVVVNANLFFWKSRNQYAEANGVINLRHASARITQTHEKMCIELRILDYSDNGSLRLKQYKSSVSSNSLAMSCTGPREADHDEEMYFLCSETEQRLVQWLETIHKEINMTNNSSIFQSSVAPITPLSSPSTSNNTNSSVNSNIPAPPPVPLSLNRGMSKSISKSQPSSPIILTPLTTSTSTSTTPKPTLQAGNRNAIIMTPHQDSSFKVYIQNQEWLIENADKGKGYKPTKDTINLLEALSYKSISNIKNLENNNNSSSSNNNNNNIYNSTTNPNPTSTFVMATPSTSSIHPSFSPIALGASKIPTTPTSTNLNIPKHLVDKLKSKTNEIVLLPGESIVFFSESIIHVHGNSGTIGRITLTNFRLYFAPYYGSKMSKKCETEGISVPLGLIGDIVKCTGFTPDKLKYYAFEIKCKDFHRIRFMHLPGSSQQKANSRLYEIFEPLIFNSEYSKLFCFVPSNLNYIDPSKGWNLYNPVEEYQRMGVPNESWRITNFNSDYYYSPTYPSTMVVPKRINDLELINITSFRSKGRIPVLVWKHPKEYAVIVRSSQPVIGVTGKRCLEDEKLIENIRLANLDSERVYIMDARPQINAVANQVMGMGYEGTKSTYSNCVLKFLNIENIHKMREAQKKLFSAAMHEKDHDGYMLKLEKATNIWLDHIRAILCGTIEIVDTIRYLKSSVIVHCSDGWDRTSQLCALSEILLDPFYRTIVGFQKLIEKEWLSFGHKFESRIGQGSRVEKHTGIEHSPVFLQFIDCVYQILVQNPQRFEFNQQYLFEIIHHLYSCRFGTFLYDCEAERVTNELSKKTTSLWNYLNALTSQWRNPSYQPNPEILSVDTMNLQLWNQYYLYWRSFHGFI